MGPDRQRRGCSVPAGAARKATRSAPAVRDGFLWCLSRRSADAAVPDVGGDPVGGGHGGGVDGEGRRGTGVAEALAHRPSPAGDTGAEEAGGHVVAEIVQADVVESEAVPQVSEATGGPQVRSPGDQALDVAGEQVGAGSDLGSAAARSSVRGGAGPGH